MPNLADLLSNLSEAQIASFLSEAQKISSNSQPAKPVADPNRTATEKTSFFLVKLLNSKKYDPEGIVFISSDKAARRADGEYMTFGHLHQKFNIRPDGSEGTHYANCFGISHEVASAAINYLKDQPNRPSGGFKPKASTAPAQPKAENDRLDKLEALIMQLAEGQFKQSAVPAKPEPGHTIEPAKPVSLGSFASGDVITVNGVAVQISKDGKRLNKTIVAEGDELPF